MSMQHCKGNVAAVVTIASFSALAYGVENRETVTYGTPARQAHVVPTPSLVDFIDASMPQGDFYAGVRTEPGRSLTTAAAAIVLTLASSASATAAPAPVTLTATVSGGTLKGTVTFKSGSSTLGTAAINKATAVLTTVLVPKIHSITAVVPASGGEIVSGAVRVIVDNALTCS